MLYTLILIGIAAIGAAGAYWGLHWLIYIALVMMFFGEGIEGIVGIIKERHRQPKEMRRGWFAPGQLHLICVTVTLIIVRAWRSELGEFIIGASLVLGCLIGPEITIRILCGEEVALFGSAGFGPKRCRMRPGAPWRS